MPLRRLPALPCRGPAPTMRTVLRTMRPSRSRSLAVTLMVTLVSIAVVAASFLAIGALLRVRAAAQFSRLHGRASLSGTLPFPSAPAGEPARIGTSTMSHDNDTARRE